MVNRENKFVPAIPVQGTILVNIADLMQRWTADKYVSTVNIYPDANVIFSKWTLHHHTYKQVLMACTNPALSNMYKENFPVSKPYCRLHSSLLTFSLFLQVHRVIIPEEELKRRTARRSVAFFYDPDWKAKITCLDGSNKYPPIKCGKYVTQVMSGSFSF